MVDSIKITALQDIGANIAYTTLVPVVNMAGTPTTQKSNLQNLGNLILNGAGGSYFPRAAQATLALSVANAAQPNITSVGTLTSLAVSGNITAGNLNGGNLVVANFFSGDGGFLTNVSSGSNYSNSNVANYLPTYAGNVGANWLIADYVSGNANPLFYIPGGNVVGTVANATYAANAGAANTATTASSATTAGTVTTAAQPNITSVGTLSTLNVSGNATVSGNLTVDGNLVYVNVTTLSVVDPIIDLQTGPNGTPPIANSGKDVGTALNYYDTQARVAFMGWDVSNAEFGMASQATLSSEVVTFNQYGNLRVGNIIGNGQALSGITGANITGEVGFAAVANSVAGSNVSGAVSSATSATTAGTVTTNAQPNITSVGTLSNLAVTGNVSANYFVGTATEVIVEAVNNNYSYHMAFVTGAGDTTLHMDDDDNLQYNPADGTMTVTRVDSGYLAVNQSVISNLNPLANVTQDLGNTTNRWKDIWLANSTIHMGNATISANGNSIVVDSITVTDGNVGTIGNVASLNLDGSNSNVLYGNGVFAPVTGGGGAVISNGNSYANVTAANGNVVIGVNNDNMTWTFATDRKIYGLTDEDVSIAAVDDGNEPRVFQQVVDNGLIPISQTRLEVGDFQIGFDLNSSANVWNFDRNSLRPPANGAFEQYDGNIRMYAMDAGSNPVASLQSVSNQNDPNIFTTIDATTTGANISVYNGGSNGGVGYTWRFDNNGLLTLPGNTVQIGSQYGSQAILASNVAFGVVSQGSAGMTALQWTDDVSNTSQFSAVYINDSSANAGDIQIRTGAVGNANIWKFGNDGNLTLPGNTFAVNYANGTQVSFGGGGNTGNVTFSNITVQGDNNGLNLSAGADFTANLAYLQVRAGDVASHIHLDTGNNQAYDLIVGDDQNYVQVSSTGNILLSAYDSNTSQYTWTLDYNGNLILAGGNSVIQSVANSSLDPLNPNVSTMILTPDANYNSQALILDPTAPGHIHLRAPGANIDEPSANLFLGGENSSFEVGYYTGTAPNVFVHSNNYTWTFGNDGLLTLPDGAIIDTTGNNFEVRAIENVNLEANSVVNIYTDGSGNAYQWQFGDDGVLTAPGDITVSGDITGSAGANTLVLKAQPITNTYIQLNSIVDSTIQTHANLEIVTDSSNTSQSWNFDATGDLTTPGNINFSNGSRAYITYGANNYISLNNDGGMDLSCNTEVKITTNYGDTPNRAYSYFYANGAFSTGSIVANGNISANNIGNISGINLDGSSSNVLYGNGVFAQPTSVPLFVIANANITANINTSYQIDNSVGNANINFTLPDGSGLTTGSFVKINPYDQAAGNFQYFVVTNGANSGGIQGLGAPLSANRPTTLVWGGSFWYYSN